MLRALQFQTIRIQAVIFSPPKESFLQNGLMGYVLGEHEARYDAPVQALPLPPNIEVPPDFRGSLYKAKTING